MADQGLAAVPAITIERYRVEHGEGFTMPVVSLTDRRAAGNHLVRFVFQRHLETVLYGRSDGWSAGALGSPSLSRLERAVGHGDGVSREAGHRRAVTEA